MPAFILEIGTEELPSRFLIPAEKELFEKFSTAFEEHRLLYSGLSVMSTPRRLVVYVEHISECSSKHEEIITGPSIKAAYDVGGRPTRALEGFAKSHGVSEHSVFNHETEKGTYIALHRTTGGESAKKILAEVSSAIITGLHFPKKMKWGSGSFTFARPICWVLALLGEEVLPFSLAGISSSNTTFGHRVYGAGPFIVPSANEYAAIIRENGHVVVSGTKRLETIVEGGNALAKEKNGTVLWNEALLDEVQGLCEYPVALLGTFDPAFLEVPREVLLTSMQIHQKSFGIESESGHLLPYFLTVLNINPDDKTLVRKGWERVLRARLEDARFFWQTDLATGLDTWLEELENVIYLAPLGTMADKSRRIAELAGWLANSVHYVSEKNIVRPDDAIRAGRICKADLVSEMVKEFPTLQGVMGGIYAEKMGETPIVAQAVAEQYLPSGPETFVPVSMTGALVSMADKVDTLIGCFGLNMIPSGTADSYALRRATLGIARILLEKNIRISIKKLFIKAQEVYGQREWKLDPDQAIIRLEEFFNLRLKHHLAVDGADTLFIEAVLLADADDAWAAKARLDALMRFSKTEAFLGCAQTFKRVANILRKQNEEGGILLTGQYKRDLLESKEEIALADMLENLEPELALMWEQERFDDLFDRLGEIQPIVDAFFEAVMVMCDDIIIRTNRFNLLQTLLRHFERLADFSSLQL